MGLQGDAAGDGQGECHHLGFGAGFWGPRVLSLGGPCCTRTDPGTSPLFVCPWTSRQHKTSPWQQEQLSTWEAIVGKFYLMDA